MALRAGGSNGGEQVTDLVAENEFSALAEALCTMGSVKFRELIRLIEEDGWRLVAQRGSHSQYEHPTKPGKVTVAGKPNADVPKGTAANILRQAGLRRPSR